MWLYLVVVVVLVVGVVVDVVGVEGFYEVEGVVI